MSKRKMKIYSECYTPKTSFKNRLNLALFGAVKVSLIELKKGKK
jgi:hypothetical protein